MGILPVRNRVSETGTMVQSLKRLLDRRRTADARRVRRAHGRDARAMASPSAPTRRQPHLDGETYLNAPLFVVALLGFVVARVAGGGAAVRSPAAYRMMRVMMSVAVSG